ncbi:MAG TPA: trehalose-phosphatase [Candidatus Nanopelagicales bacterium]|nr:trehalose-phosphatase [Candidatus Nanopelagicales bacterium]
MTDSQLSRAVADVVQAPRLLVGTDFDGTLAEIVEDPADARPVDGALEALRRVAACEGVDVVVLSGRSLRELRWLMPDLDGVRFVGSHGAERDDGRRSLTEAQEQLRARVVLALSRASADVPGALLERKPAGAAVHVRRSPREDAVRLLRQVREGPATWPGVIATEGKEVLELSVVDVDKGRAFARLRDQVDPGAAVFLGDDVTDENVFVRLGSGDLGVKVGTGPTRAAHRVDGPRDAVALLEEIAAIRTG